MFLALFRLVGVSCSSKIEEMTLCSWLSALLHQQEVHGDLEGMTMCFDIAVLCRCLVKNTTAVVEIEVDRPVCIELYSDFKDLGRFMLRSSGTTIAAGIVTEVTCDYSLVFTSFRQALRTDAAATGTSEACLIALLLIFAFSSQTAGFALVILLKYILK